MRSSALALSLALALPASAQSPAFLVKDVNVEAAPPMHGLANPFSGLSVVGDVAFFSATAPELENRFWITDGTEGGTLPVTLPSGVPEVPAGPGTTFFGGTRTLWRSDGTPETTWEIGRGVLPYVPFEVLNAFGPVGARSAAGFLFSADDGAGGRGLWRTDGTAAGTELVRAFLLTSSVAHPTSFRAIDGVVFFVANDGVTGRELWRSDGTAAGTTLVADLAPGSASALPQELTVIGSELWFTAETAIGRELYKTDGTTAGTVLVKDTRSPGSGAPTELTLSGTTVFFAVDGATANELWKSDGTEAGTALVASFSNSSASVADLEALGSEVLFKAHTAALGAELWKSDGTITQLVREIVPGNPGGSGPYYLMRVGDYVYFHGGSGATEGLWRTDGTEAGTILLSAAGGTPLASLDGETLLLVGGTATQGRELWRSDGTPAGTTIVKNIGTEAATASGLGSSESSRDWSHVDLAGTLIFDADDGLNGDRIWRSDGTSGGTVVVTNDVDQGPSLWAVGAHVYFRGQGAPGTGLWRTDGTAAGTVLVSNVSPSTSGDGTERILDLDGVFLFSANTAANGFELWRSDGTAAGTHLVEDLAPGTNGSVFPPSVHSSVPLELTKLGSIALFTAAPSPTLPLPGTPTIRKLVRTDGTEPGTFVVDPPGGLSEPRGLVEIGGLVYFLANDSLGARRLWRSDGTAAGTAVVPIPVVAGDVPSLPVALGSQLVYVARTPSGDVGVWRTDGTAAGTSLLAAYPLVSVSTVVNLRSLGSRVTFTVTLAAADGIQLYVTDGTPAGTGPLKTSGIVPHFRTEGVRIGDRLLYSLCDSAAGCEPWVTDGTDAGTRRLADVGPGGDSSFPVGFIQAGDFVYFSAYDSRGRELWAVPASTLTLKACEDGWDNDGDGGVDAADPGCGAPTAKTESPQCNDGVDNDGDSAIDLADPNCNGLAWRKETAGCGLLGIEGVVFAAAVLARRQVLARRRARAI